MDKLGERTELRSGHTRMDAWVLVPPEKAKPSALALQVSQDIGLCIEGIRGKSIGPEGGHGRFLIGLRHWGEGRPSIQLCGRGAVVAHAADLSRHHTQLRGVFTRERVIGTQHFLMAVDPRSKVLDQAGQKVVHEVTALGGVGHRVAAEVVDVDVWVDAPACPTHVVGIVAKLQQRVGGTLEDGGKPVLFCLRVFQALTVPILDDPFVVRARAVVVKQGLFFWVAGEVDGWILHH